MVYKRKKSMKRKNKRKGIKYKHRVKTKHKRKINTKHKRRRRIKNKRSRKTKRNFGRGFFGKSKNPRKNPDDFEEAFKKALLKKSNKINLKKSINVIKSRTPTIENIKRELSWLLGGNK